MTLPKHIAVIFGGVSGEHEVSVRSAQSVMGALREAGYVVVPVFIGKDGAWQLDGVTLLEPRERLLGLSSGPMEAVGTQASPGRAGQEVIGRAFSSRVGPAVDMVFPVLHGTLGEDGTLQGLLEVAEVPYVGSGVLGSALGMDKIAMKMVFRAAGLPVVDFGATTRLEIGRDREAVADRLEDRFSYPIFVKPANLGSSVGITKAHNRAELLTGLSDAALYDRRVIAEQGIEARELEVSVLGNDQPEASAVGEVVPGREFYDYDAKYADTGSHTIVPAPIPDELAQRARSLAVEAFRALDLAGMARVDFLLEKGSNVLYLSEANTIPGFTDISMFAKLWQAGGLDFPALVSRLVELGWERHLDRQRSLATVRGEAPCLGEVPNDGALMYGKAAAERP